MTMNNKDTVEALARPYKDHLREQITNAEEATGYLSACYAEGPETFALAVKDVWEFAREDPPAAPTGAHPEDFCERCKRPNIVWFAPSELWNKAVRAAGQPEILCPVCFVELAEAAGIAGVWKVAPQDHHSLNQSSVTAIKAAAQEVVDIAYRDRGQIPHRDTIVAVFTERLTSTLVITDAKVPEWSVEHPDRERAYWTTLGKEDAPPAPDEADQALAQGILHGFTLGYEVTRILERRALAALAQARKEGAQPIHPDDLADTINKFLFEQYACTIDHPQMHVLKELVQWWTDPASKQER